jgi:Na+/H+ antiporter NhaD/arsenite permease-like protein
VLHDVPAVAVVPFGLLLLCIAVLPLALPHFWEKNRNKALVALALGAPVAAWVALRAPAALAHTAHEYLAFILLLGALYIISGGVLVRGDLRATPAVNTAFLGLGALLANLIGTTGASMLLIRVVLRTNAERKRTRHLPIFFIFVVSNCAGLLTPLGDPPLFLGFLRGVPFEWTLRLFPVWLLVNGALLLLFFLWDRRAYRGEAPGDLALDAREVEPLRVRGLVNFLWLGAVLATTAFQLPSPWREVGLAAAAVGSLLTTSPELRRANAFIYAPIAEVAILFAGIFATMIPALALLAEEAPRLGVREPWQFFWLTGALSSFLDNAPTYLTFLSLAQGLGGPVEVAGTSGALLSAISVGAVLMGANTYIGNGPNFMVKAIAESQGVRMPSFFGYMGYTACVLLPLFLVCTFLFFL